MKYITTGYAGAAQKALLIDRFKGVDMTGAPPVVDLTRSPYAPNMVRDVPGKVRKRMGYKKTAQFSARINGLHTLRTADGETEIVHAGTALYIGQTAIYTAIADRRSAAFQLFGKLYIADGGTLLVYNGQTVTPASNGAYRPLLTINRSPSGGGTDYEAPNLLTGKFKERFSADGTSTVYQLSLDGLDSAEAQVRMLNANSEWASYTGSFTVNAAAGTVTFASAPPVSPIDGADNIEISAVKTVEGYADRINGCTVGAIFGVNGSQDRLFLSGNPEYPNLDFHSEMDKPDYFPDTGYGRLGQESCAVAGYLAIGTRLFTFKSRDDDERNIVIRSGEMSDGRAVFPIENILSGAPAASSYCFAAADEPLFLSTSGVFAITTQDITGTQYTQNRSYYINKALCAEENLEQAMATIYNDFYVISVNDKLYLLDMLAKEYQKNEPYSSFQYECYLLTGISARVICQRGGKLRFGTANGELCEFYTDSNSPDSYNDNGEPISACWTTPDFSGDIFYRYKDVLSFALKMSASPVTSVRVLAKTHGVWREATTDEAGCRYLCFSALKFSSINFSCDSDPRVIVGRLKLKRASCAALRFENKKINEPFSMLEFGIRYRQTAEIKRLK